MAEGKWYTAREVGYLHSHGRIECGARFQFESEPYPWMKPDTEPDEEATQTVGLSRKEIMSRLDAAGVQYFKGAPVEKLKELLI